MCREVTAQALAPTRGGTDRLDRAIGTTTDVWGAPVPTIWPCQLSDRGHQRALPSQGRDAAVCPWPARTAGRARAGGRGRGRRAGKAGPRRRKRRLDEHGTTPDGRLFRGVRGGPLSESLYGRLWAKARAAALTAEEVASPLARRPYDLRHAAVCTWLNGGVPAPQVAAWAGHSVDVLLRVYAKCIAGQEDALRRRVEEALRQGRS